MTANTTFLWNTSVLLVAAVIGIMVDGAVGLITWLWTAICLSLLGWTIFAVAHFVLKYW